MSKSVLIIDDRPMRPYLHLTEDIVYKLQQLPNVNCRTSAEGVNFEEYDVIAIHKSYATSNNLVNTLDKTISNGSKYIVYFSGGISQQAITRGGHQAIIGSDVFYSKHLFPFCEQLINDEDIQLFKLIYGLEQWRLPILMRLRQLNWMNPDGEYDKKITLQKEDIIEALGLDNKQIEELNLTINQLACRV